MSKFYYEHVVINTDDFPENIFTTHPYYFIVHNWLPSNYLTRDLIGSFTVDVYFSTKPFYVITSETSSNLYLSEEGEWSRYTRMLKVSNGEFMCLSSETGTCIEVNKYSSWNNYYNGNAGIYKMYSNVDIPNGSINSSDIFITKTEAVSEFDYLTNENISVEKSTLISLSNKVRKLIHNDGYILSLADMMGLLDSIKTLRSSVEMYDAYNELSYIVEVKKGLCVLQPMMPEIIEWKDDTESTANIVTFPYKPSNGVSKLYAQMPTNYADRLYHYFGVNKTIYPYMWIFTYCMNNDSEKLDEIRICFFKSLENGNTDHVDSTGYYWFNLNDTDSRYIALTLDDATAELSLDEFVTKIIDLDANARITAEGTGYESLYTFSDGYINLPDYKAYTLTNFDLSEIGVTPYGTYYDLNTEAIATTSEETTE